MHRAERRLLVSCYLCLWPSSRDASGMVLGVALLELCACLLLLEPAESIPTLGLAAYVGSLILALSGVAATRRERTMVSSLSLRAELNEFAEAELRRFSSQVETG